MRCVYEAVRQACAAGLDTSGVTAGQVAASTGLDMDIVLFCLDALAARSVVTLTRDRDRQQSEPCPSIRFTRDAGRRGRPSRPLTRSACTAPVAPRASCLDEQAA